MLPERPDPMTSQKPLDTEIGGQTPGANDTLSESERQIVRERAHALWEMEGSPEGRLDEYWHRARELIEDEGQAAYPPTQSRGNRT